MRKHRLLAILCVAIVCAALITAVGSAFAVKSMAATTPWTGTWSASPESGGQSFSQQTLRQIVHTSIGGTSAQVQVSNVFGTAPLQVADVHVALRSSGSTIVSGSDHTVTFGGQTSITIPAGGLAVSDAVAMSVPALSDVAVSMYLPQSTGSSTYHQQGTATNYIASGDVSGNATLSGAQTTNSYFFLANLNVQNTAAQGAVVTFGASITDGYASTTDANERWPNDLAVRLANSGRTIGVLNQGINGNRLLADSSGSSGQSALDRFSRDVLSQPGVKWVIFSDDPINDLGSTSPPPTSAQLIAGLQQLISTAHQNGIKFLCSTLTPYQGAGYWTQQGETAREAYNAYVLGSGSGCDGVIDQAAATSNPSDPTMYLPAYDSGDHLHPNDAGYQAIANAVNLNLFGGGAEGPYGGTAAAVPGTVQAANYDTGGQGVAYNVTSVNGNGASYRSDGVDLETTADTQDTTPAGGPYDLGWTATGQWFKYTVNVAAAGSYTVSLRLASPNGVTDALHIANSAGTSLSSVVAAPDTGGWQTWTTVTTSVTLPAGQQTLTIDQDNGGWNIHDLTFTASGSAAFGGTPAAVPGTVQAANYDTGGQGVAYNVTSVNGNGASYRSDGVDLETTADTQDTTPAGGPYDLGWTAAGQWFKYTVNVSAARSYTVSLRLASPNGVTDGLHIASSSGANLSGNINVPATGGWQTWTTVTVTVTLPAGQQTLTIDQDNGGWNIHQLTFA
jgi:lysophospholipase L1-like esterase